MKKIKVYKDPDAIRITPKGVLFLAAELAKRNLIDQQTLDKASRMAQSRIAFHNPEFQELLAELKTHLADFDKLLRQEMSQPCE